MSRNSRPAFTIVELLVVIGILALLLGMLLPALSGVQKRSQKSREMHSLKQIGIAWQLYSNANADHALPGYLGKGVQQRWNVTFEYQNNQSIPPGPTFASAAPNYAGPWPWRLLPLLQHQHDMVHGHLDEPAADMMNLHMEAAEIALEPGFGYNAFYVGGWWKMIDNRPRYWFFDATADLDNDGTVGGTELANVVVKSTAAIRRSSELIIFCSSAHLPMADATSLPAEYRQWPRDMPGSFVVMPPRLADELQWSVPGIPSGVGPVASAASRGSLLLGQGSSLATEGDVDRSSVLVLQQTSAPIGRYNKLAAILYADLHTDAQSPAALLDMRKWIDRADTVTWGHRSGLPYPPPF